MNSAVAPTALVVSDWRRCAASRNNSVSAMYAPGSAHIRIARPGAAAAYAAPSTTRTMTGASQVKNTATPIVNSRCTRSDFRHRTPSERPGSSAALDITGNSTDRNEAASTANVSNMR